MFMIYNIFIPLLLLCVSAMSPLQAAEGNHQAEQRAQQHVQAGNWEAAREAFAEAAQQGSPTAMAYLGWIHEQGHGIEASDALAAIWYTRAVEAGASHLAVKLGWLHLTGSEVVRNRELSEEWFLYGIEQGDLDAHVALSSLFIADALGGKQVERVTQARKWLLTAHQQGHPVAKFFLVRLYLEGIGGHPIDYEQAHAYARLGAEEGQARMQAWLALIYKDGLGREVDQVEAAKWAMLSSLAGDPHGQQLHTALEAELSKQQMNEARERAMAWASK